MFSSNDIHSSNSESIACLQASIAGSKPSGFDRHACLGTLNRHRLAPQSIRTIILTKNKSKVTVGSDPGIADVAVQMTGVSRKHFTIEEEDGGVMLKDHSTNGTFVNHTRIHHSQVMLLDGTQISLEEGIVHHWTYAGPNAVNLFDRVPGLSMIPSGSHDTKTKLIPPKLPLQHPRYKQLRGEDKIQQGSFHTLKE